MTPHLQFRRHAKSYDRYNIIQTRVARELACRIPRPFAHIVDLGCGSGGFFRAYEHPFTSYLAVDIAPEMLARHPQTEGVEKWVGDFDDAGLYERLAARPVGLVVSASALQWSKDLGTTLGRIAALRRPVALAIFTDGTFASIRRLTGTPSPIRSREETEALLREHFDAEIDMLSYKLHFPDTLSMLRYIKRSGVSGGARMLSYGQTRALLERYPHDYLEFEIVLAVSRGLMKLQPEYR